MPLAVALIVLVVGSLVFHFVSPWTFTPIASNWGMIDSTVDITFVVTGIVFVAVNLFMAYAIIRYRHRDGLKAHYEPENKKLEIWLTVLTTIGVAAMLTPGLFVWAKFVAVPEGAMEIEAIGQQWKWTYRLPGNDGEFGIVDAKLIGTENPFGIDPDDPNGNDDVLVDDRDESPGRKFNDADLIGIPARITIGKRNLVNGNVEINDRRTGEAQLVSKDQALKKVEELINSACAVT